MKGLIIDTPHIDNILSGRKSWEMRSTGTATRGTIALIRKGSGTVIGVADLIDSMGPFSPEQMVENMDRHRIPLARLQDPGVAKWNRAWVMQNAKLLRQPVRYRHPSGAVIWVNLDAETAARVEAARQAGRASTYGSANIP